MEYVLRLLEKGFPKEQHEQKRLKVTGKQG
jgi:hypothetical protein